MTFLQLYGSQLDIELASSQTTLFTTVARKKAVNDGQLAFARMTECFQRIVAHAITDGVGTYDVSVGSADFMWLAEDPSIKITKAGVSDRYIQGDDLQRKDTQQLDFEVPGWRSADPGTPTNWYMENDGGVTRVGFFPPPDVGTGETWTWRKVYVASPPDMTGNSDEPFTLSSNVLIRLRPYHQALVHYAAAMLEPLRKNYAGVQRQMSLFNGYVAMYLQDERGNGPDQITSMRNYFDESVRTPVAVDPRRWP